MFSKIKTFIVHLLWHIGNGMPKSSQYEINKRYSICIDCEYHNKKEQECNVCGCNINNRKIFMNKLAWKDQKCPLSKW